MEDKKNKENMGKIALTTDLEPFIKLRILSKK